MRGEDEGARTEKDRSSRVMELEATREEKEEEGKRRGQLATITSSPPPSILLRTFHPSRARNQNQVSSLSNHANSRVKFHPTDFVRRVSFRDDLDSFPSSLPLLLPQDVERSLYVASESRRFHLPSLPWSLPPPTSISSSSRWRST